VTAVAVNEAGRPLDEKVIAALMRRGAEDDDQR
jgi:hypothetical protein